MKKYLLIVLCCISILGYSQKKKSEVGMSSYYGKTFHGRKTASGENFNMYALTAAHKRLPLQTLIKVTNLRNKKTVIVRVNDRGPYAKRRILDLSYAAAKEIGMVRKGTARVKIEILGTENIPADLAPKIDFLIKNEKKDTYIPSDYKSGNIYDFSGKICKPAGYAIQVISFVEVDNLKKQYRSLKKKGYEDVYTKVFTKSGKKVYEVCLGIYATRKSAEKDLSKLKKIYKGCFVKKY